ncbi:MAG: hypothetical protein COB53_03730 [Elusimicrobia bacterium]|nr:MAG: hypothetical protein COB53_03730 [Elusimicrobiota bacterium]
MPAVILACLVCLGLEFYPDLEPAHHSLLRKIDLFFLSFFVIDLMLIWKDSESTVDFFKNNWLSILALIPVIRVLRAIRFSALARLARLGKLSQKGVKALNAASKTEKVIKRVRKGVSALGKDD